MSTKVYFGPYVQAQKIEPSTQIAVPSRRPQKWLRIVRRSLANLAPSRQMDESGTLLVVETALCATLLGTVAMWLQGSGAAIVTTMLAIDGLLVAWLLIGTLVQTVHACRRATLKIAAKPTPNMWAYRVADCAVSHLAEAPHSGMLDGVDWSALGREAVLAADLGPGDLVFIDAGQMVVADGTIVDGFAMVDESIVTGQSDPVIRSADGEPTVLRNSRVVAGEILVRISPRRGHPLDWDPPDVGPTYIGSRRPERNRANSAASA